jgi:hypothetical protein
MAQLSTDGRNCWNRLRRYIIRYRAFRQGYNIVRVQFPIQRPVN